MNFEAYYAEKLKKDPTVTKKRAEAWWQNTAAFAAQHKSEDDYELPDKAAAKWFQKEYSPALKYLRRGQMGVMEDLRLIEDWDQYDKIRKTIVRPLKKDTRWDFNGRDRPLIKAGQIPPPRLATTFIAGQGSQNKQVTRRGCQRGTMGIPCDHPPGSSSCNGGVPVLRRMGEMY